MVKIRWSVLGVLLLASPSNAENQNQISFGCAPWDGQTLQIEVSMPPPPDATDAPPVLLKATIWGQGLEALRQGVPTTTLAHNGNTDMKGNGYPLSCTGRKCIETTSDVIVQFSKAELHEGGNIIGTMKFDIPDNYQTFPFSGTLRGSQRCG